jgi:hypothetical protein
MTRSPRRTAVLQNHEPGTNGASRAEARRLDVRLASADHDRIVEEAIRRHLSVSTYVRQALLGQVDYTDDHDAHMLSALARALDMRAEAFAETAGEIALTLLERIGSEPISPEERRAYVAGAVECFRDALRRRLQEEPK